MLDIQGTLVYCICIATKKENHMSINSSHSAFIVVFDKVWKKALVSAHNINEDGSINWNYVESDVYIDMSAAGFDIVKHEKMLKQELDFVMENADLIAAYF